MQNLSPPPVLIGGGPIIFSKSTKP